MNRWLNGARVVDLAPNLVAKELTCCANSRSVKEGMAGNQLKDYVPDISVAALTEFF
jgi:hypothetical protein